MALDTQEDLDAEILVGGADGCRGSYDVGAGRSTLARGTVEFSGRLGFFSVGGP
jgi:hypothetical protein